MEMQDYKRALYDFSAAIRAQQNAATRAEQSGATRAEQNKQSNASPTVLAEYYMYAGRCNQMLGQYHEALAHYKYGIDKDSAFGELYYHQGLAWVSINKYQNGIDDFQKALQHHQPKDGDNLKFKIWLNLGINLRRVGKLEQSVVELKNAITLQSNKAQAHNNLGLSLFELQDWSEALQSYSKAINLEAQSVADLGLTKEYLALYLNNKGLALYHLRNFQEAITEFDAAIEAADF